MTRKLLLENTTCSRCGGSGQFSYCQSHGTTCFKCHGAGVTLTPRGKAAQDWMNAQKAKLARDVRIGDKIVIEGVPGFSKNEVVTVTFVGHRETGGNKWLDHTTGEWKSYFTIDGTNAKGETQGLCTFEHHPVKMFVGGEALAALRAAALEFQATLTKTGTVAKRKATA